MNGEKTGGSALPSSHRAASAWCACRSCVSASQTFTSGKRDEIAGRHIRFGRAEVVEEPAHAPHVHGYATHIFTVGRLQAGYVREWPAWKGLAAPVVVRHECRQPAG